MAETTPTVVWLDCKPVAAGQHFSFYTRCCRVGNYRCDSFRPAALSVCLGNENPNRLVSLFSLVDLVAQYGTIIARMGRVITELGVMESLSKREPVTEQELNEDWPNIDEIVASCRDFDLWESIRISSEMAAKWTANGLNELIEERAFTHLRKTVESELNRVWMRRMFKEEADLYLKQEPFGPKVADKFGGVTTDIEEAGKCLALGRPTASVFHLMRVMERAVQCFGSKLGVQEAVEKNWQSILDEINKKIKMLPESTPELKTHKSKLAAVAAYLYDVKLAWRNPAMHPKELYTPEEGGDVYHAVKVFVCHLAEIV